MNKNLLLFAFFLTTLFSACHKNDDQEPLPNSIANRTNLIYIVADNNLSAYASRDIEEMIMGYKNVDQPELNNLLVYIDDYSTPRLLQIKKQGSKVITDTIYNYTEHNSVSKEVMSYVIGQVLEEYEAKSYGLSFWSHGDGWLPATDQAKTTVNSRAFGEDRDNNMYGEGKRMDILDLRKTLEEFPKFDFILFDACDMQSIEVAYELKNTADYFIASVTEVPAYGANYADMVPALFSETRTAEQIAEAYYLEYYENYDKGLNEEVPSRKFDIKNSAATTTKTVSTTNKYPYGIAISVIKSSELDFLAEATKAIIQAEKSKGQPINTKQVTNYDSNYYNFYYDLGSYISSLSSADPGIFQQWEDILAKVVPLNLHTPTVYSSYGNNYKGGIISIRNSSGISVFIPNNNNFADAVHWEKYPELTQAYQVDRFYSYYLDYYHNYRWSVTMGW